MAFIKKYGFWFFLVALAVYWGYRKWPHEISISEIQIERDGQMVPVTLKGDSALVVH